MAGDERLNKLYARALRIAAKTGSGPLLAVDAPPDLSVGLAGRWSRYHANDDAAKVWPEGQFNGAVIRLNRVREATQLAVAAALSCMPQGGPVIVFGFNDEGIRSTRSIADLAFETVEAGSHGRVLIAKAPEGPRSGVGATLQAWLRTGPMPLPSGIRERWSSYPGCFARGTLDAGTALLLATLDDRPPPVRVLDYAAGTGPIAEEAASRWPAASVFGIEMDAIALAAARQNAPRCRFVLGSDLSALPGTFDLILSNPPFHVSRPREDAIWRQLIQDAPGRLERGGELRMVVQREVPAEPTLREAFKTVQRVAQTSGYDVWSAR